MTRKVDGARMEAVSTTTVTVPLQDNRAPTALSVAGSSVCYGK
jgi:hypothetical protein